MNQHDMLKDARKAGSARADEGQTFKKPFQTVRQPPTIVHNMHDDFVRNPPKNVPEGEFVAHSSHKWTNVIKNEDARTQEGLGRVKQADVQRELVEESSVHS